MWRGVTVLAVVLVAGLVAACGGDDDPQAATTTTTAADESTTTTDAPTTTTAPTPTPTTTFAQADEPPPLVNTGEDFDAIVRSFLANLEWVSVHPATSRLEAFIRVDSPAWQSLEPLFTSYANSDTHTDGAAPAYATETRVQNRIGPDQVLVYLAIENPAYDLLDASGNVLVSDEGNPLTGWIYELRRGGDGTWLVEEQTNLGEL